MGAFVITGATSGIGMAVARILVQRGHDVIGVGRDTERCLQAEKDLTASTKTSSIKFFTADLGEQKQVRRLANDIINHLNESTRTGLHGLVNNAATVPFREILTSEEIDTQWAVNYLAGFLLSHLLLDDLAAAGGRIVNISSGSHYGARLNLKDMPVFRRYNPLSAYKRTKLAQVLFTEAFNRKLGHRGVRAFAAEPGLVKTNIGFKSHSKLMQVIWKVRRVKGIPPDQAARGIVFLLLEQDLQSKPWIYWKHGESKRPNMLVRNKKLSDALWERSLRICGLESGAEGLT